MPDSHPASQLLEELFGNLAYVLRYLNIPDEVAYSALNAGFDRASVPESTKQADFSLSLHSDNLLSSMVWSWANHPDFVDQSGDPRILDIEGSSNSFSDLYSITANQNPKGAAEITFEESIQRFVDHRVAITLADGRMQLVAQHFPSNTVEDVGAGVQLQYINDYVSTSAVNIHKARKTGRFMRIANTLNFPTRSLPNLDAMLRDHGMQFLHLIDDYIEETKLEQADDPGETHDVGVGVYLYVRKEPELD
jgi:hypothetical protein